MFETQVRALIHSRLDYCNGILSGLPAYMIGRLQSVLKASARLVLKKPPGASVSAAITSSLHWLPFPQRITFKTAVMTYKCLHELAPPYLARRFTTINIQPRKHKINHSSFELQLPTSQYYTSISGHCVGEHLPPTFFQQIIVL